MFTNQFVREGQAMTSKFDLCIALRAVIRTRDRSEMTESNGIRFTASVINEHSDAESQGAPLFGFTLNLPPQRSGSFNNSVTDRELLCNPTLLADLFFQVHRRFSQMDQSSLKDVEETLLRISAVDSNRGGRPWLERARTILQEEFAEQPTLSYLAAKVGVHPVHLAREFRRLYGSSVGEYVRKLRIDFACHQLLASDDPPVKIATAAGFVDQSHFSRTFKRFLGTTPGRYRAALKTVHSMNLSN